MFSDASQSVCFFSALKKTKLDPYTMYFEVDKQTLSVTKLVASACCDLWLKYWQTTNLGIQDYMWDCEHLLVYGVDSRDKL